MPDIEKILKLHIKWINREIEGVRADLQEADLQEADLRWANLQEANLQEADLRKANLRGADLRKADLQGADLQRADLQEANLQEAKLRWADLRGADLRGADLDFSCWPLWCGFSNVKIDEKQAKQLAAHCFNVIKDFWPGGITEEQRNWINEFHRIKSDEFPSI